MKTILKKIKNNAGMSLQISEGPEAIKQQAIKKFPEKASIIQSIINDYIQIRYGSQKNKQLIEQFLKTIQHYKA